MFWGMILKPDTRYKTTVEKSFRISHAALEFKKPEDKACVKLLCKELEFIICYLDAQNNIQIPLDLCFERDEEITLVAEGTAIVHLTGLMEDDESDDEDGEESYDMEQMQALAAAAGKKRKQGALAALPEPKRSRKEVDEAENDEDESDDSDFDVNAGDSDDELDEEEEGESEDDEDLDDEEGDSDLDMSDMDMESFDEDDDDEEEESKTPKGKKQQPQQKQQPKPVALPKKEEKKPQQPQGKKSAGPQTPNQKSPQQQQPQQNGEQESGKKKKKRNKKKGQGGADGDTSLNGVAGNKAPASGKKENQAQVKTENKQSAKKENQSPAKTMNKGGVQIQTLKPGTGPTAAAGKHVHVYYRGRLQSNGKEFDKQLDGKGFRFRLGSGEVIKGWDVGVEGMKVGEKRRLTVPSNLAYGEKGAGKEIPPNSTLVFDVELKAVS
jgi:FK506-binding nuclear protein